MNVGNADFHVVAYHVSFHNRIPIGIIGHRVGWNFLQVSCLYQLFERLWRPLFVPGELVNRAAQSKQVGFQYRFF